MTGTAVFLWETGRCRGVAGTRDRALEAAGAALGAGGSALVEEAQFVIAAGRGGSLVPGHERTGLAWRGRLRGGKPVWAPAAEGGSRPALAGRLARGS